MQTTLNRSLLTGLVGLVAIALSVGFAVSAYADDGSSWNGDWNQDRDKKECDRGKWEWSGWNWWWNDSWNDCDFNKHSFSSSVSIKVGGHDFDRKDSDWQNQHDDNDGHDWKSWDDQGDKDWKDGKDGRDGKDGKDGWDGGNNRW